MTRIKLPVKEHVLRNCDPTFDFDSTGLQSFGFEFVSFAAFPKNVTAYKVEK
jgi:hypothetical protein